MTISPIYNIDMQESTVRQQLIDDQRKYYESNFSKVSKTLNPDKNSKDYYIISIIGVQNSGKSTLLNQLFGTQFQVLATTAGTQTTKGIWISKDKESPFIVLDVEGNDSMQRAAENDNNFEKTVAMFALALSNVLIVNIWSKSVGTFEGSQYGILKILMEMSLRMFKQEAPKVILFCLRDFDQEDSLKYVTSTIIEDVEKIWIGIQKPQNFQKTPRQKFFSVKVHACKRYRPTNQQNFIEDVGLLRAKMTDPANPDYIFAGIDQSFNLPIRDLQDLSKNAWSVIVENKDLNLPNQKIQLANLRCDALKEQLVSQFVQEIKNLTLRGATSNLRQQIQQLVQAKTKQYQERSQGYDRKITKQKEEQLTVGFTHSIEEEVEKIAKTSRDQISTRFQQANPLSFDRTVSMAEHFNHRVETSVNELVKLLDNIKFTFPQKRQLINSFQQSLRSSSNNKLKELQQENKQDFEVGIRRKMTETVSESVNDHLDQKFWQLAQQKFNDIVEKGFKQYSDTHSWITNQKLTSSQICAKKRTLQSQFKSEIKDQLQLVVNGKLVDRFNSKFRKDAEGNTHNWLVIDDQKIEELFEKARKEIIDVNRALNDVPIFSQNDTDTSEMVRQQLFEPNKLSKLVDDLSAKMTQEYQDTIRSKKQTQMSKVPWYLWVIFAFFTYDDIWFSHDYPFVYYPSTIVLSILALLVSLGYKDQLFALFTFFMQKLKSRFSFLR